MECGGHTKTVAYCTLFRKSVICDGFSVPTTLQCTMHCIMSDQPIMPHPTTTFFVLHWIARIVQPSYIYLIVPYHTSLYWIVHPSYPIKRPTLSYPPSYHNLLLSGSVGRRRLWYRTGEQKVGWMNKPCSVGRGMMYYRV